jgi:hypothetical protein
MIDRNRDQPVRMPLATSQSLKQGPKNPDASYSFGKNKPTYSPNNRMKPDEPFGSQGRRPN